VRFHILPVPLIPYLRERGVNWRYFWKEKEVTTQFVVS